MPTLSKPRAKYGDSVIIKEEGGDKLLEILIHECRGFINENNELFWGYYPTGKSGDADLLFDDDILMNLNTGKIYQNEI